MLFALVILNCLFPITILKQSIYLLYTYKKDQIKHEENVFDTFHAPFHHFGLIQYILFKVILLIICSLAIRF